MQYFLETSETIAPGLGFAHYDATHIVWLVVTAITLIANCIVYRKLTEKGRSIWKKVVAVLLIADELFKMIVLFIGGRYTASYLPLHLCSLNIFMIALHAWRPSETLDNFLYTICIPGALAALLFPSWSTLPPSSGMHLHSFTVHILLLMYPLVLFVGREIRPDIRMLPKSFGLLFAMVIPIYGVNLLLNTNFMFLMSADPGNPLEIFQNLWGSHLLGFPVIIAGVLLVMYGPIVLYQKLKKKSTS